MPFLASLSARQGGFLLANASKIAAPTFGVSTGVSGGYTFSILNFSALNTYSFSVTNSGSATQSSGAVTVTSLASETTATCTVTVSRAGFIQNSANTTGTSFTAIATPALAAATSELGSFTVVITNFDAASTYIISTTSGSVSRSGSTITNSGLANSFSATITVTETKSGFEASNSATRTGSAIPACTFTGTSYQQIGGGNCSTCGIICCSGGGVPAFFFTFFVFTPYPCNLNGSKITTDPGEVGPWFCLTTGTGSGLSCGPGSQCNIFGFDTQSGC